MTSKCSESSVSDIPFIRKYIFLPTLLDIALSPSHLTAKFSSNIFIIVLPIAIKRINPSDITFQINDNACMHFPRPQINVCNDAKMQRCRETKPLTLICHNFTFPFEKFNSGNLLIWPQFVPRHDVGNLFSVNLLHAVQMKPYWPNLAGCTSTSTASPNEMVYAFRFLSLRILLCGDGDATRQRRARAFAINFATRRNVTSKLCNHKQQKQP